MQKDRESLLSAISSNTLRFRIKQWVDNFLANQKYINGGRGVASLMGMLQGMPAAVIGSGPTLDRNIKDIHLLKNKALIISCDSAVKALEKFDVHPHIIMITDSKRRVADFIRGIDVKNYSFVCDTFIHPETIEVLQDAKRVYWYSTLPIEACPFTGALNEWTGYVGNLGTGGCVATTAWWLAVRLMGADPNIMIGLPEALYDPGNMYSTEVSQTVETEPYTSHLIDAFDIFGKACYTYPALQSFAWWFQDAFLQIPGIHLNCSEGGIMVENCLNMPLLHVINQYLMVEFDPEMMLFNKEMVVDKMFEHVDDEVMKANRVMLEIMLDGPSVTNLALRMGEEEPAIIQRVEEIQKAGFVITETESTAMNPDGTVGDVSQVFMLTGFKREIEGQDPIDMTVEQREGRHILIERKNLNLDERTDTIFQRMMTGLPPMNLGDIARLVNVELADAETSMETLLEKRLVLEVPTQPGVDESLYIAEAFVQPQPFAPQLVPTVSNPVDVMPKNPDERYNPTATNPTVTDEALLRIRSKWFPTTELQSNAPAVVASDSEVIASHSEVEGISESQVVEKIEEKIVLPDSEGVDK